MNKDSGSVSFRERLARAVAPGHPLTLQEIIKRYQGPQRLYTVGRRFARGGRWALAEILFEWAAQLWSENLGPRHAYVSTATAFEGWCLLQQGDLQGAASRYERALDIAKDLVGAEAPRAVQLEADLDWIRGRTTGLGVDDLPPGPPDRPEANS